MNKLCHKLAPKETKKDVSSLVSYTAEETLKYVRGPNPYDGDLVALAIVEIPYQKDYKQPFIDELYDFLFNTNKDSANIKLG